MAERLQMFSADPVAAGTKPHKSTFPWAEWTDGSIWKVEQGTDYESQRGLLAALTKRATKESKQVRFVRSEKAVEFEFSQ